MIPPKKAQKKNLFFKGLELSDRKNTTDADVSHAKQFDPKVLKTLHGRLAKTRPPAPIARCVLQMITSLSDAAGSRIRRPLWPNANA